MQLYTACREDKTQQYLENVCVLSNVNVCVCVCVGVCLTFVYVLSSFCFCSVLASLVWIRPSKCTCATHVPGMSGEADHLLGIEIRHGANASKMEELPHVNIASRNRPAKKNVHRKVTRKFRYCVPSPLQTVAQKFPFHHSAGSTYTKEMSFLWALTNNAPSHSDKTVWIWIFFSP